MTERLPEVADVSPVFLAQCRERERLRSKIADAAIAFVRSYNLDTGEYQRLVAAVDEFNQLEGWEPPKDEG